MDNSFKVSGNIVDVINQRIFQGTIHVESGSINAVVEEDVSENHFIMPGFVDAHVHIESSMLIPSEFARLAVVHGTVATISDPHEIGNVLGVDGVKYMIDNGKKVPFKFHFGAPSCVPATSFETAGAEIDLAGVKELLAMDEVFYLAEMMNFQGVLNRDPLVIDKIAFAHKLGKQVDGHAPGLRGDDAKRYIDAGITTDHECFTREEALDKLKHGMKILIREGSAAKNFEALIDLLNDYPDEIMFCSDDKHPNDLMVGHINQLAERAIAKGIDAMKVLRATTLNPVKHYGMNVGLLRENDRADLIVVENLSNFKTIQTYIDGQKVAENGETLIDRVDEAIVNNFNCNPINIDDIKVKKESDNINVIEVLDGQLITNNLQLSIGNEQEHVKSSIADDILKIVVVNRYSYAPPAIAFTKNFGLKKGAIASSVAHDSHNIIAVGVADEDIVNSINLLIETKGGVSLSNGNDKNVLALPVAGLMSNEDGYKVGQEYDDLDKKVKAELGSTLTSPYMTLSFCALLVIPDLKLSNKGLFSGKDFQFVSLFN
ncbi:MAG: adenine deaminase [Bacteroidetes bacterium]|nr:MAG: adenine deaminase [Bacteroidota bacterium]